MNNSIKIFAPATVSNVGCGFDTIGFALKEPGDIIALTLRNDSKIRISKITGDGGIIPFDISKNTASVAVVSMIEEFGNNVGVDIEVRKKMPIGSGLGSSAASAVGAVYGLNELLGNPFSREELLKFAIQGESIASGAIHADNVAPCLLGGLVLIRDYNPLDVVKIPPPEKLFCTVIYPHIYIETSKARKLIKKQINLKKARRHFGNIGSLVAGFYEKDIQRIGKSIVDEISEPARSMLIPGFHEIKKAALQAGSVGCSISGSGPSIFAFSDSNSTAKKIANAMQKVTKKLNLKSNIYISKINKNGPVII